MILVITNDFSILKPSDYYTVFSPLWHFDGVASEVMKYL